MIKIVDLKHNTLLKVFLEANFFPEYFYFYILKIIVEVAHLKNFTIGRCPVSEIYAIKFLFRRRISRQNRDTMLE